MPGSEWPSRVWVGLLALGLWTCAYASIGAAQQASPFHVLKIAAGPSGAPSGGRFVFTEERATFSRTDDREVIVSFEWEGAPGRHKLVATWRSQDGGATSSSALDYTATGRRFAAFWSLPMSATLPLGTWSIEATVDGEPGGRFAFDIIDTKPPAGIVTVAPRQPLGQSELYARLREMFVRIERFSAAGRSLDPLSGVLAAKGRVYTTMAAVDDVDRVRAVPPVGAAQDVTSMLAWNRGQDWAVLQLSAPDGPSVAIAPAGAVKVGDRCFSMEGDPAGGGVLVELSITGARPAGPGGGGWLANFANGFGTPGAPVVNEHGELVGIVGAAPNATRLAFVMRARAELSGVPIVPFSLFRVNPDAAATSLADLRSRGDLIPVLVGEANVVSGGFSREILRTNTVAPSDQRQEFSAKEGKMVAFVTWSPVERVKGNAVFALYDADNHPILKSQPRKVNLGKGQLSLSSWQLPLSGLDGTYRGELLIDDKPMWRGFVKVVP